MKKEFQKTDLQYLRNAIINQVDQIENENTLKIVLAYISKVRELSANEGVECIGK